MKITRIKPKTQKEFIYFCTTRIETDISVGTGFFASIKVNETSKRIYLVTNKHLFFDEKKKEQAKYGKIKVKLGSTIEGCDIEGAVVDIDISLNKRIFHKEYDIVACNVSSMLSQFDYTNQNGAIVKECFFSCISFDTEENLPQNEGKNRLDLNEEVTFLGYPNGIFDSKHPTFPVFRNGHIATPIGIDYEGQPEFLIDAVTVPGSSGSPVFVINEGGYKSYTDGKFSNNLGGSRIIFLGILAYCLTKNKKGLCVKNTISSNNLNYSSDENGYEEEVSLYLGGVIKRSVVKSFLEEIHNHLNSISQ